MENVPGAVGDRLLVLIAVDSAAARRLLLDGLLRRLTQLVATHAASKQKRAIKAHTDISAQTQRGVNPPARTKMKQASAATALFVLSLSLWQKEKRTVCMW